jgi:hypothetical protein
LISSLPPVQLPVRRPGSQSAQTFKQTLHFDFPERKKEKRKKRQENQERRKGKKKGSPAAYMAGQKKFFF